MRSKRQCGFTLLEVLVAFTIFALSFAAILQIYSQRLQNVGVSDDYGVAVGYAESLIARVGVEEVLAAGSQVGELENGMHWTQSINRHVGTGTGASEYPPYRIDVVVSWKENDGIRKVQLTTLRLSAPQ